MCIRDSGITCEEIDESKVSTYLDTLDYNIILTGEVGEGILKKMNKQVKYSKNFQDCLLYTSRCV